jgi:putative tryptophan/tyrosine transport system substrate-binding protein
MLAILLVSLLSFLLSGISQLAEAQQPKKVPLIGFLAGGSRAADSLLLEAFWRRMNELGYIEGKNIAAEYRFAEGAPERLPNFAEELVRLNVDVIVGPGSGVRVAKNATKAIPIVITYAGDPVGSGLVPSLSHPGGNVTGLSGYASELGGKMLELLKETVPRVSRVAVFSGIMRDELFWQEIKLAAVALRVTLRPLELLAVYDLESAFSAIKGDRANALIVLRSPFSATHRKRIVDFAANNRLPSIYADKEFVDAGGLMSYGVNVADLWGRAAVYVDKILKGTKPADLPVELPKKFDFVINLKAAKQIGLTIPPNVLARADRVIR